MIKKRLLIMVPTLGGGGQERVAATLTYLLADTYDIKMLLFDSRKKMYDINCDCISLELYNRPGGNPLGKTITAVKRIIATRKIKKEWQADICLSFGITSNYVNALSAKNDKAYLSLRGFGALEPSNKLVKCFDDFIFSKAEGIISVSKVMTMTAKKKYPKQSHKFSTLYNPYDTERIEKLASEPYEKYQHLFEGGSQVIMAVGSYKKVKGQWHLIKAFSLVKKKHPNAKLLVFGGATGSLEKLQRLVTDLELESDVVLGSFETNPFSYLKHACMFVLPSLSEGLPNALLEAMSCGVPIVATDCQTGPREILSDSDLTVVAQEIEQHTYGILVPPLTWEENYDASYIEPCEEMLAQAIEIYLDNPELADAYRQKSCERVKFFSKELCKETLTNIFDNNHQESERNG